MKVKKILFALCFALSFGILLGLGLECLLILMGEVMAISLDSNALGQYPRFIPFCVIAGFLSLVAIIALVAVNIKLSDKIGYTRALWMTQAVTAIIVSLPFVKVFEMLFDLLQKTF